MKLIRSIRSWLPLFVAAATLTACGAAPGPVETAEAPVPVLLGVRDVTEVGAEPLQAGVRVTGSLNPAVTVQIRAQIAGLLERVVVERGSVVRAGALLVEYDARTLRARVAEAAARVEAARRDFDAADLLYREGAASHRDQVQAKVAVESALAQLEVAEEGLRNARVVAPIAGVVNAKEASSGEAVRVGDALLTLVDLDTLELAGRIPAAEIGKVFVGQAALLHLEAYPGQVIPGRVARIESVADPQSRQVTVYVEVDNPDHRLVGGLFATGNLLTDEGPTVPVVPETAIRGLADGRPSVLVIGDETLAGREVQLGARDPERGLVQVIGGLQVGERIVTDPAPDLRAGQPVRLDALDGSPESPRVSS